MKVKRILQYADVAVRIARDRLMGSRSPYFAWLMPTSRCNLQCTYCFADFSSRPVEDISLDIWERIIDGLHCLGTRHISLTGGEPMMRRDISRIIGRIHGCGIECLLNSNGFMVAERIAELVDVDLMSISLDGLPEINDRYRGAGSYNIALKAVRAAREHGIEVQLLMTLTEALEESFEHILSLAETYDCFIGMNILRPRRSQEGLEAMSIPSYTAAARSFLDHLLRVRSPRLPYPAWLIKRFRDWPYDYDHCIIYEGESMKEMPRLPCIAGRFMITIDAAGNLYPCARHCYKDPLANCADGDVERAWRNLKTPSCQSCLDFGWTLLNGTVGFRPLFMMGLFRSLFRW